MLRIWLQSNFTILYKKCTQTQHLRKKFNKKLRYRWQTTRRVWKSVEVTKDMVPFH